MSLTMAEKIRVVLNRRNMTVSDLADALGQSRQNLSNKLSRDNFTTNELKAIAEALECDYEAFLVMRDKGERI